MPFDEDGDEADEFFVLDRPPIPPLALLLVAMTCTDTAATATATTSAATTGENPTRGRRRRREEQVQLGQPPPSLRLIHKPAVDRKRPHIKDSAQWNDGQ